MNYVVHPTSEDLVQCPTKYSLGRRIHERHPAFAVNRVKSLAHAQHDGLIKIERALQSFLGFLALRDVAEDLGSADDFPILVLNWRNRQETLIRRPSLQRPIVSKCSISFAAADSVQNLGLFRPTIAGNKHGNRLADRLRRGVAENALGALIPSINYSVEIFADDRVVGGFNYCRQPQQRDL